VLPLSYANRIGRPGSPKGRAATIAGSERIYTFEELLDPPEGATAVAKTQSLLEELGFSREDWEANTALYQRSQRRVCLSRLQKLQTDIVKSVTERRVKLRVLHRPVRAQYMARRFLGMINTCWKPLDNLVAAYNAEVQLYNEHVDPDGVVRLHPPSSRDLREVVIDDDHSGFDEEVINRLMQGSDCCALRKRKSSCCLT
jgi:hypothetical protein